MRTTNLRFLEGKKVKLNPNLSLPGTLAEFLVFHVSSCVSGPLWQCTKLTKATTKSNNFEPMTGRSLWKVKLTLISVTALVFTASAPGTSKTPKIEKTQPSLIPTPDRLRPAAADAKLVPADTHLRWGTDSARRKPASRIVQLGSLAKWENYIWELWQIIHKFIGETCSNQRRLSTHPIFLTYTSHCYACECHTSYLFDLL